MSNVFINLEFTYLQNILSMDEIEFKYLLLVMNTLYFDVNFESKSVK